MENPHLSSGMTASTHIWAAESNPESLHQNAVHLHLSFTSPSITKRGEKLISRWQLHCLFGQINPTQNIPDERSRRRMLGLFYSSPSGLTAVKFCVLKIWFWLEHQEKIPLFLEVRSWRGEMQVQAPCLNDPNVPVLNEYFWQLKSALNPNLPQFSSSESFFPGKI